MTKYNQIQDIETYKEKIITAYKEGITSNQLAREYNVNRETMRVYLKNQCPELSTSHAERVLTPNKENIIEEYLDGASTRELGKKYNVIHRTIQRYLESWGVARRKKWEWSIVWDDWVRKDESGHRETRRIHCFYDYTCQRCGVKKNPYDEDYDMQLYHIFDDKVYVKLICGKCWKELVYIDNYREKKWGDYVQELSGCGSQFLRRRVHEFYDFTCQKCGDKQDPYCSEYSMHIHHEWKKPVQEVLLCKPCHDLLHNK